MTRIRRPRVAGVLHFAVALYEIRRDNLTVVFSDTVPGIIRVLDTVYVPTKLKAKLEENL